jgi:hypothetical protein
MKSPVSTLVRAILKGNLVQAQEAFDATMRPRVQAALEVERVAVAKTITECPVMEDEEDPKVEEDTDPEDDKKDDLQEEDEDEDESEGGLEEHAVAGMDVKASGSDKWVARPSASYASGTVVMSHPARMTTKTATSMSARRTT